MTLKLKTTDFVVKSRAITLAHPISKCGDLFQSAKSLLEEEIRLSQPVPVKLRLMGKTQLVLLVLVFLRVCMHGLGVRVTSLTSKRPKDKQQSLISFLEKRQASTSVSIENDSSGPSQNYCQNKAAHTLDDIPSQELTFVCPICMLTMRADNEKLNYHIDQCLNTMAVNEAVKEFVV